MATTTLHELTPDEFLGQLDTLLAIYASAMRADAALLPGRRELMRRHAEYPKFQALIARAGAVDAAQAPAPARRGRAGPRSARQRTAGQPQCEGGPAVGFAYGFRGGHGQWWFDAVWTALSRATSTSIADQWLTDCMEVAELHVHETSQHAGTGTRLLTTLTTGRPERTAVLSTPDSDTTARRLYRRLGFRDLLTNYSFPGGSPPYAVMGAVLPLSDAAADGARPGPAGPARSASPSIW